MFVRYEDLWAEASSNKLQLTSPSIYSSLFQRQFCQLRSQIHWNVQQRVWRSIPGADQECWTSWLTNFDSKALEVIIDQIIVYSIVKSCAQIDTNTATFPSIYSTAFSNYFEARYVQIAAFLVGRRAVVLRLITRWAGFDPTPCVGVFL